MQSAAGGWSTWLALLHPEPGEGRGWHLEGLGQDHGCTGSSLPGSRGAKGYWLDVA